MSMSKDLNLEKSGQLNKFDPEKFHLQIHKREDSTSTMSTTTTTQTKSSGDQKPTKFVNHVKSYPTVQSGVSTFKSYPIGEQSVNTVQTYFDKFLAPYLHNLSTPYSYIAPLLLRADGIADSGLGKVDTTFPLITKDPSTIKSTILDYAYTPLRLASDGRSYVTSTYSSEYKKCGGDDAGPLISGSKAAITTSMVVTSDTLVWMSHFLSARKKDGQEYLSAKRKSGQDFASAKYAQGSQYVGQGYEYVNGKKEDAVAYASETAEKAKSLAYAKGEEAKGEAENVKNHAKKQAGK